MKAIFDEISIETSRMTTKRYSTSFSMGIRFLHKRFRDPIYAIYGFVRFADEIVDTFHGYPKRQLLADFWKDTHLAIENKISLNPILNSFQQVFHEFNMDMEHVENFLRSMEMDLEKEEYDQAKFETYILGSAEVVGLMCLHVFTEGDREEYERLRPSAMKLGSAFQKINFLRDLKDDYNELGRAYFPSLELGEFSEDTKSAIEADIDADFQAGYEGIKQLPKDARFGVYMAYVYYHRLLKKIQRSSADRILEERVRIPNKRKYALFVGSLVKHSFNLI